MSSVDDRRADGGGKRHYGTGFVRQGEKDRPRHRIVREIFALEQKQSTQMFKIEEKIKNIIIAEIPGTSFAQAIHRDFVRNLMTYD